MGIFEREALLIGEEGIEKLAKKTVAVFGLGGVGSFVCEALARAGVGKLLLIDSDTVSESNINRQLFALHSTVGRKRRRSQKNVSSISTRTPRLRFTISFICPTPPIRSIFRSAIL